MPPNIHLRPAQDADIPAMVSVFNDAFQDNAVANRCFPPTDPASDRYHAELIYKKIRDTATYIIIATISNTTAATNDSSDHRSPIAGWARWMRRPELDAASRPPPVVFTPDMYPPMGDGVFAARFFQANHDAAHRVIDNEPAWFLSTIVVASEYQRMGVGGALMQFGVDKADEEGWAGCLNATAEGKKLYEKFGFSDVDVSEVDGIKSYHMKREPRRS